mmetsp:Transcript_64918/g.130520  ORF Transcript_64918/g.130520 Transcript_64918/m.130520 type:complete len:116 (+) Transcript_64918:73-420(+)
MAIGSFTYTAIDGCATTLAYDIDGDGCLVRSTTVVQGGAFVDPKTNKVAMTAQCNGPAAIAQLDYFAKLGVDVAAIKATISKADLKPTAAETKKAQAAADAAAYAASSGGGAGDY